MQDDDLKVKLTAGETWIRGAFMLLFAIIYQVVELVLVVIAVVQWFFLLFTGEPSERLLEFGDDLSVFNYQIWQFQTMNTEVRPWPFAPWPYAGDSDAPLPPEQHPAEHPEPAAQFGAEPAAPEAPTPPAGPGMDDDPQPPVTDGDTKPAGPDLTDEDEPKKPG